MVKSEPLMLIYSQIWSDMSEPFRWRAFARRLKFGLMRHPKALATVSLEPLTRFLLYSKRRVSHQEFDRTNLLAHTLQLALLTKFPCQVITNRRRLTDADIVIFHVPTLDSLPPEKEKSQIWVAFSQECEVWFPLMSDPNFLAQIDYTAYYSFDSDIPCPYFHSGMLPAFQRIPATKTAKAPAVLFLSSQLNASGRFDYTRALMNHLPVHSYGRELKNCHLAGDEGQPSKLACISRYKFTLAFENAKMRDYVTEKLYEPLMAGSIPVYLGAPNVDDFAPGENCFINVDDFDSPAKLAAYLHYLDEDDNAYASYHAWRTKPLRPAFLNKLKSVSRNPYERILRRVQADGRL